MIHQTILENGTTILIDQSDQFSSVSLAVCILGGLRDEQESSNGLTHLLEHMLFKRTKLKQTRQIAESIDALGGNINAFTDTDSFCLHGFVSYPAADELLSFFAELLLQSEVNPTELALEKEVIRQEILEADDDPIDAVSQRFCEVFWPNSMLARPVFGTLTNLDLFDHTAVTNLLNSLLVGKRIIVAVSGHIDTDSFITRVDSFFGKLPEGERPTVSAVATGSGISLVARPVQQSYLAFGIPWPHLIHEDYYAGLILATAFGGCMSSRLFQVMREDHGLAYDIHANVDAYRDTAALVVTANIEPRSFSRFVELFLHEKQQFAERGVKAEELERIKKMLLIQTDMDQDSIQSRLWQLVESEMIFGRYVSNEEIKASITAVSLESSAAVLKRWTDKSKWSLCLGGSVEELVLGQDLRAIAE